MQRPRERWTRPVHHSQIIPPNQPTHTHTWLIFIKRSFSITKIAVDHSQTYLKLSRTIEKAAANFSAKLSRKNHTVHGWRSWKRIKRTRFATNNYLRKFLLMIWHRSFQYANMKNLPGGKMRTRRFHWTLRRQC